MGSMTVVRMVFMATICGLVIGLSAPSGADEAVAFRTLCANRAAEGDSMAVAGIDGWLFLRSELRHLGVGPFWGPAAAQVSRAKPDKADPLPAIADFSRQLADRGITLLVAPVPCKAAIHADKLGVTSRDRIDTAERDFQAALGAAGIAVVDLAEPFVQAKADATAGPPYCRTDTHWSPRGCEIAAVIVARRVEALDGAKAWLSKARRKFVAHADRRHVVGDLGGGGEPEDVSARVITAPGGGTAEDRSSPVLLLGDSHVLVFHAGADLHGTNAGLADQMAFELGIPIDVLGVRGSGATPARINLLRRAKTDPNYLGGKKVIVWCFAAREFTEGSGWALVPLPDVAR